VLISKDEKFSELQALMEQYLADYNNSEVNEKL
jgi:hypothetical protein